jgi:hypothetical protein
MTFFLGVVVQRNLSKQINSLLSWNLRLELCVVCRDCPVFCRDPRTEAAAFHHHLSGQASFTEDIHRQEVDPGLIRAALF